MLLLVLIDLMLSTVCFKFQYEISVITSVLKPLEEINKEVIAVLEAMEVEVVHEMNSEEGSLVVR